MRFEQETDLKRERHAIERFVSLFSGSFEKLGPNDVDFKVFDKDKQLIAYAEVKGRNKTLREAYPLPISARKVVKLCDKRLNPVIIWACEDAIIWGKVHQMYGSVRWGGRVPRPDSHNDQELMLYYDKQDAMRYLKF